MYLSLKGSLGHTPITDRVGEGPLQIAEGAAAAYSLRNLGSDSPSVVRVRRESDNNERDFTAQDISTSVLTNWVNQQITPPLDLRELTATGRDGPIIEAAAAYSLRNLSDSYAGDVVEVRRNTDGALKDFKASEVTDGTLAAWVNTSFANALPLDTAGAAAAAYSLRNLSSSYTGSVVEVRRSSDGALRSFTAAEVTDGTLITWVNTDIDKLDLQVGNLDAFITNETATGFDFSVNSEGSNKFKNLLPIAATPAGNYTVTLDVALNSGSLTGCNLFHTDGSGVITPLTTGANSLNLTSDAAKEIFFYILGTASADVSITNLTLTQTSADGTVSKWYDQSGNDNHATQGTSASQPKIVSGGSLVTGGLAFDGVNDNLQYNYAITNPTSGSIFSVFNNTATSDSGVVFGIRSSTRDLIQLTSQSESESIIQVRDSGNLLINPAASSPSRLNAQLSSAIFNKATPIYDINVNGGQFSGSSSTVLTGSITVSKATIGATDVGTNVSGNLTGTIQEIIYYNSDQSDKRRAIEENIGSNYGITLTSSKDGTVSKWYDQSTTSGVPNAKHAVQTSAAKQPKIVDGGSLVLRGNKPSINFFNNALESPVAVSQTTMSVFTYAQPAADGDTGSILRNRCLLAAGASFAIAGPNSNSTWGFRYNGVITFPYSSTYLLSMNLHTFLGGATGANYFSSGSNVYTDTVVRPNNTLNGFTIGRKPHITSHSTRGYISEMIIYNTDQSDNRTALEANIGEVYGIAGIPAYDNTVNGFVETWYDQSGNGNNATQLTAGKQPKIVDAGSLFLDGGKPALRFDGVDDVLNNSGANPITSINNTSSFAVISKRTTSGNQIAFSLSGGGSRWFGPSAYASPGLNFGYAGTTSAISLAGGIDTVRHLNTSTANATTAQAFFDGTLKGTVAASAGAVSGGMTIGTYTTSSIFYWDGAFQEVIIYNTDQTANRLAIEANINNQYDIY